MAGSNVVDLVAADGGRNIAIGFGIADLGALESATGSPAAGMA